VGIAAMAVTAITSIALARAPRRRDRLRLVAPYELSIARTPAAADRAP
jgi:hypothetical protein